MHTDTVAVTVSPGRTCTSRGSTLNALCLPSVKSLQSAGIQQGLWTCVQRGPWQGQELHPRVITSATDCSWSHTPAGSVHLRAERSGVSSHLGTAMQTSSRDQVEVAHAHAGDMGTWKPQQARAKEAIRRGLAEGCAAA